MSQPPSDPGIPLGPRVLRITPLRTKEWRGVREIGRLKSLLKDAVRCHGWKCEEIGPELWFPVMWSPGEGI